MMRNTEDITWHCEVDGWAHIAGGYFPTPANIPTRDDPFQSALSTNTVKIMYGVLSGAEARYCICA